jgi:Fe2+ transport system protein FeoA
MRLKEVTVGQRARIVGYAPTSARTYVQKLLAMGLTPNTWVLVKRIAPMGDPIQLSVRGYDLTLRLQEADVLEVEYDHISCEPSF